jgi:uncharacterized membrane protein YeaQ/YmgE (transglycosylase-associated protein family)
MKQIGPTYPVGSERESIKLEDRNMSIIELLILLVIAAICGAIGQAIAGYTLGGMVITTIVGFIGALLGTWMARAIGLPELLMINVGGQPFPIIWAIIGSAVFTAIVALFTRRPRGYYA